MNTKLDEETKLKNAIIAGGAGRTVISQLLKALNTEIKDMKEAAQRGEEIIIELNINNQLIIGLAEAYGQDEVLNKLEELLSNELISSLDAEMDGEQINYNLSVIEVENTVEAGKDILQKYAVTFQKNTATKKGKNVGR